MIKRHVFIHNHNLYGDDVENIFLSMYDNLLEIKNKIYHNVELFEYYSLTNDNSMLVLKYSNNKCRLYTRQINDGTFIDTIINIIKVSISDDLPEYANKKYKNYDKIIEAETKENKFNVSKQTNIIKSLVNAGKLTKEKLNDLFSKEKNEDDYFDVVPTDTMIEMGKIVSNLLAQNDDIICVLVPNSESDCVMIDLEIMIISKKHSDKLTKIFNNLYMLKNDNIKSNEGIIQKVDKTISSTSFVKWIEKNLVEIEKNNQHGGYDSDSFSLDLSD